MCVVLKKLGNLAPIAEISSNKESFQEKPYGNLHVYYCTCKLVKVQKDFAIPSTGSLYINLKHVEVAHTLQESQHKYNVNGCDWENMTYKISICINPCNAVSAKQVISLWSSCLQTEKKRASRHKSPEKGNVY